MTLSLALQINQYTPTLSCSRSHNSDLKSATIFSNNWNPNATGYVLSKTKFYKSSKKVTKFVNKNKCITIQFYIFVSTAESFQKSSKWALNKLYII